MAQGGSCRFGLIDLIRGTDTLAALRRFEALEYAPPAELDRVRQAALAGYVARLRDACPLYRDYGAFAQFPVLDKATARTQRARLRNSAYRGRVLPKKTSGSTGVPFTYESGVRAQSALWAGILLSWRVAGYQLGEPVAFLAGSALFGSGARQRLYYQLMNVRLLSAFALGSAQLDGHVHALAGCRLLYGYASAIFRLAQYVLAMPRRPRLVLRGVVCTAEVLSPAMRAAIERAFGVPCFSQYGCNEAGVSAYECERRDGFHLLSTRAWHEVLPGGRLLATDLANDAMFLPRYDTGDLVQMTPAPCPCGRSFPLIASVIGRANDLVHDGAGNSVHSEFFSHLLRSDSAISAFQVIYDAHELVLIVHACAPLAERARYLDRIGSALRFNVIRFEMNRPFICIKNGKHRFVMQVSNVRDTLAG
jgi:phenylacetate-CoA ligase